ncbi:MAG: PQQ-like beta-propeller repeat protein [Prosthecobacter sp.]|nr:PQQ-like beta-propeller repeat protein [Prosthecobacter sp.]
MRAYSALLFCLLSVADSPAADWPRFLGPTGTAIVKDASIPTTWSAEKNIAWKFDMPGPGSSSPIVVGEKVFLTCWTGYGDQPGNKDQSKLQRHLICLSLADGKKLWQATVPSSAREDDYEGFITEHGYATSTPVSDGSKVFVFFGKTGAAAYDMAGSQLWLTQLGTGSSGRRWGSGGSPILYKNTVIVNATDESKALVALDKETGKERWRAGGDMIELAYSTPLIIESGGRTDLVFPIAQEIWGLNPDTGKLRWFATHGLPGNISPALIPDGDLVYLFGGYPTQDSAAVRLGGKGDVTSSHIAWRSKSSSYVPTPILHEGHLYVVNDAGFALCMEAKTGKEIYRERVIESGAGRGRGGKPFYASPVLIGDKLYAVSRRNGTFILAAKPTYEKLASIPPLDDSQFHGTPAVSGDRLILRSDKAAYCIAGK